MAIYKNFPTIAVISGGCTKINRIKPEDSHLNQILSTFEIIICSKTKESLQPPVLFYKNKQNIAIHRTKK